ncbi:MAG TPA: hypothetical protein VJ673_12475 [Aromatoleum sp.]|uniref:hypothetical protein n=1 Tax=Aromatoleum sp. TaxID=2307007 RepID=UPI002B46F54F|nr:hypothetical protein [Aromatoleum sp.]HJV26494.1 hypothetical protein [Aromatoleum sp.]
METRILLAALSAALLMSSAHAADVQVTYEGCTDAVGRPVPAVSDPTIDKVVESRSDASGADIRYNPEVLPRLLPETRLFLFAHECARHNLGYPAAAALDVLEAARADCVAVDALLRSHLLAPEQIETVQRDLQLSPGEWAFVPGPARRVALKACIAQNARRHALTQPSANQPNWNACVRSCGDRRRVCQSQGTGCDDTYERCVSLCDFRSAP